jgi:hypothetical protein
MGWITIDVKNRYKEKSEKLAELLRRFFKKTKKPNCQFQKDIRPYNFRSVVLVPISQ